MVEDDLVNIIRIVTPYDETKIYVVNNNTERRMYEIKLCCIIEFLLNTKSIFKKQQQQQHNFQYLVFQIIDCLIYT